ncbi:MAG: outer membrane beta-barrel protein [Bacteroidales bacterium]|nr:outer membrane beta-barrel protein [Bacteroidales bacterium]
MKRIITLIAAAVMMTIATNSFAQMQVGAGFLHSNESISLEGMDLGDAGMNGGYAGVSYNLPIADNFGIAPGLYYSLLMSNESTSFVGVDLGSKMREHYLNVPVYFNFGFNLGQSSKLFIFAGPTAQFGIASTSEISAAGISSGKFDRFKDGNYSRTNVLLGGGLGLNISKFQISLGYDQGLFNLNTADDGSKIIKSYAKIGLAYLF